MKEKKPKNVCLDGPIDSMFIGESIARHQTKTDIGAHHIFLGQVRSDEKEGKTVKAIEYSAYDEMAETEFHKLREAAFDRFDLSCMHIYHSLGVVKAGEICMFVFVSSKHRDQCREACNFVVEQIKANVPIFGKELLGDESHSWKVNQ